MLNVVSSTRSVSQMQMYVLRSMYVCIIRATDDSQKQWIRCVMTVNKKKSRLLVFTFLRRNNNQVFGAVTSFSCWR